MAWGARPGEPPTLIDPYGGALDARAGVLRAVGDPATRFEEDALRMIRAVRLATTLEFEVEAETLAGIRDAGRAGRATCRASGSPPSSTSSSPHRGHRSGSGCCRRPACWCRSPPTSRRSGAIAQNKVPGEDLWDHTLRSVDASPAARPAVRLAALLHDIGKPATFADGHFLGHDAVGAELAEAFLERLHAPRSVRDRVVELVRLHMFSYEANWSDAAVRRFIGKLRAFGDGFLEDLLALREADNVGSGLPANAGRLDELRARIATELAAEAVLDRSGLVDRRQ